MDRGLYIAAAGMLTEQVRQDQIANDLANASTPGYKADRTSQTAFNDILLQNTATGQTVGRQALGVEVDAIETDFTPAPVRETGEPLDFAILGEGFFAVQTEQGVRYTRNGQFSTANDGTLTTARGDAVLGTDGRPVRVGADGRLDPRALRVVQLDGPVKEGESFVTGTPRNAPAARVRAGALEGSGADPTRSMVDMIASLRAFEAGQRVITTIDETLGKATNQVGAPQG